MDNRVLADMIREKYYEQKMTAEYKLKLNKVVEMKYNFLNGFSKDKWKKYLFWTSKKVKSILSELTKLSSLLLSFCKNKYF